MGCGCNGLEHCSVQVTQGYSGFSIEAYGEEAGYLYRLAEKYCTKMTDCPVIV